MAIQEHVEVVKQGAAAIAQWRARNLDTRLDLREADLSGANLSEANLRGAYLCGANLREASLRKVDLYDADLHGADLRGAYLSGADLGEAYLRRADLRGADLRGAYLRGTDLSRADLRGACLGGANLREACLGGANLRGANLSEALWDYTTIGTAPAPEGDLIGWGKKGGLLVKMLVPAAARRSCATTRKFRAEYVQVLEIESGVQRVEHFSEHGAATYEVGQITRADEWDDDRWNECSHGIHFFLSRHEAERWA